MRIRPLYLAPALGLAMVVSVWSFQLKESSTMAAESSKASSPLAHNVYFTLADGTSQNRDKLVAACKKYLVKHPGVLHFSCGIVADLEREVNDRGFDVGLHIVFKDRASHDRYQTSADHLKFIEENRSTWKQVRVFDDDLEVIDPS